MLVKAPVDFEMEDEWHDDCDPCNHESCVIDLGGSFRLAQQNFGEWQDLITGDDYTHKQVKSWAYFRGYNG